MRKLHNKVAVITGGNSGIGLTTAVTFQKNQSLVILEAIMKLKTALILGMVFAFGTAMATLVDDSVKTGVKSLKDIPATRHQLRTLGLLDRSEFARFTAEQKSEAYWKTKELSRSQEQILGLEGSVKSSGDNR